MSKVCEALSRAVIREPEIVCSDEAGISILTVPGLNGEIDVIGPVPAIVIDILELWVVSVIGSPVYGVKNAKSEVKEAEVSSVEKEKLASEACTASVDVVRVRVPRSKSIFDGVVPRPEDGGVKYAESENVDV